MCVTKQESEKKEAECGKNAQDFRDKYKSLCHQLGIEGKNIKKELTDLLTSLPEMYKEVATHAKKNKDARILSVIRWKNDQGRTHLSAGCSVYNW